MTIVIENLRHEKSADGFDAKADVTFAGGKRELVFRRTGTHPDLGNWEPKFDPFVVALLIPAMERGHAITVRGSVNETILAALTTIVQPLIKSVYPYWSEVPIDARPRSDRGSPDPSLGAATGMSCGVDSLFTFDSLRAGTGAPAALTVRLLLHNDVGGINPNSDVDHVFRRQRDNAARFASKHDVPLVSVVCKLDGYFHAPFIFNHTLRNLSAAMTVDHLFHSFLYSSDTTYAFDPKYRTDLIGIEPALLPRFNTTDTRWSVFGGHATRLEKMIRILDMPHVAEHLNVCLRGYAEPNAKLNCGWCVKCARVVAYLRHIGAQERFQDIIDFDAYDRHRHRAYFRMVRHCLGRLRSEHSIDMLNYLNASNYPLPSWVRPIMPLIRRSATTIRR